MVLGLPVRCRVRAGAGGPGGCFGRSPGERGRSQERAWRRRALRRAAGHFGSFESGIACSTLAVGAGKSQNISTPAPPSTITTTTAAAIRTYFAIFLAIPERFPHRGPAGRG